MHRVHSQDALVRAGSEGEARDDRRALLAGREYLQVRAVPDVAASDIPGLDDAENGVRRATWPQHDDALGTGVRGRAPELLAGIGNRRHTRVAVQPARPVPDVAELERIEGRARGTAAVAE